MLNLRKVNAIILSGLSLLMTVNAALSQDTNSVRVGPLELSPTRVILRLEYGSNGCTYFVPTIQLRIINTSVSDIKVILFRRSVNVTDNLGEALFNIGEINSSGILLSDKNQNEFGKAFQDERGKFVTLAPRQTFEAQITRRGYGRFIKDRSGEFMRSHQPRTISFSATLGIINLDDSTELRAFSFSEVPLSVARRAQ